MTMIDETEIRFDEFDNSLDVDVMDENNSKENFYQMMKAEGLDFYDIDEITRLPKFMIDITKNLDIFNHFNNILYKFNKNGYFSIIDSVKFIGTDFLDEKALIKLLDEMNFYLLTNELKKRYKIDKVNKGMFEFFA